MDELLFGTSESKESMRSLGIVTPFFLAILWIIVFASSFLPLDNSQRTDSGMYLRKMTSMLLDSEYKYFYKLFIYIIWMSSSQGGWNWKWHVDDILCAVKKGQTKEKQNHVDKTKSIKSHEKKSTETCHS